MKTEHINHRHCAPLHEQITACERPDAGDPNGYTGGPVFVGVDIAARNDLFVNCVLEQVGDVLWTREIILSDGRLPVCPESRDPALPVS
jgi:hypothetical protein